jgi:hypothetical protein
LIQRQGKVALDIRSYLNTDSQALCRVYNAHYQAAGLPYVMTPLSLELCVLAKPYFDPSHLLVAVEDGTVIGFALVGFEPSADLRALSTTRAVVSGLCVMPHALADQAANELIVRGSQYVSASGATHMRFCPPPPASPYLAGLAPGDAMIGCPELDLRQQRWLIEAGWSLEDTIVYWNVDLAMFHPPMDRMQIQIRRMAHVDRLLDEPMLPWYVASMLGHSEQIGFQLTARDTRSVTADIVLWTIGYELLAQPDSIARLWPLDPRECQRSEDQLIFLLAEAFRQLREDRIDGVRTVSSSRDIGVSRLLQRIGFEALGRGSVYATTV